jgi:opacity protein-like surface antigen
MRSAALAAGLLALAAGLLALAAAPAHAAVTVSPVGVRPHGTLTVHVTGRTPQTLSIDGRRVATARHATTRLSLRDRFAQGRHRLRACRGRSCSTSAPFVVTGGPILAGCPILPADSAWNTDIRGAPLAADSATLVGAEAAGHNVHLDFGDTQSEYGIPFSVVGPRQRRVPIAYGTDGADYGDESDHGPFPIPPTAAIEGAPAGEPNPDSGDRHVIVIQRQRCVDYELYNAVRVRGGASWEVSSSARWDLTRNGRRPAGWTSADAAGLPIFPGLLRYEEAASGTIRHALRFTLPRARRAWQAPASHCGTTTDASAPPYGSRWRLKASFDESPYHGPALAIVRALKRYGLMFADQGSAMYITGTTDRRWTRTIEDINQRHPIPGDAFEVVAGPPVTPC